VAILKGTLDVLVLKTLSGGPMHAFEVANWLEQRSDGRVSVEDAALLQALRRMEVRGLLTAEWRTTKHGRRARYYRLTVLGKSRLRAESSKLADHVDALSLILASRVPSRS
jgi:PadR family transcriptional regulator